MAYQYGMALGLAGVALIATGCSPAGANVDGTNLSDACAPLDFDITPSRPILQFAVDISGSMLWDATNQDPEPGEPTKWELAKAALTQAIAAMPETVALGMSFFPNTPGDAGTCIVNERTVPIGPLTAEQKQAVIARMAEKMPEGGTATHDALLYAYETLEAAPLPGRRFAVLLTDGAPTYSAGCTTPPQRLALRRDVERALIERNLGTFVLGAPGSQGGGAEPNTQPDARSDLSHMAQAGGTAPRDPGTGTLTCTHLPSNYCHFDLTGASDFGAALVDALSQITSVVVEPVLNVPAVPSGDHDPASLVLLYVPDGGSPGPGSVVVPKNDPPCVDGWAFTDTTQTRLELCGSFRALVETHPEAHLVARFACGG